MNKILILSFCLSFSLLPACYNTVNTMENTDKTMEPEFVRNKQVVSDEALGKRLQVMRVDKQDLESGLMKIQVSLRNTKKFPCKFAYKFQWFNESGMLVVTSASTWVEKEIIGGEESYISAVSPNERCKDFKVQMKLLE